MTDQNAEAVARGIIEQAIRESGRDDATIERVYLIPDRNLFVVAVAVDGTRFRASFSRATLTENPDQARQQARQFVTDGLPKRTR